MNKDKGIVTSSKSIKVFTCPICNCSYTKLECAESCWAKGQVLAYLEKVYKAGCFLLMNGEAKNKRIIIPVNKFSISKGEACDDSNITFTHVDSNDNDVVTGQPDSVKKWLTAEAISITDAVINHGWRACFGSCWETGASIEMKDEYIAAIDKIIAGMSEQIKQATLRRAIMFKNQ